MQHVEHDARVARLVERITRRRSSDGFASLRKSATSHFVPDPHDPRHEDDKIDVRELEHVLDIDVAGRTCTAEPGVTFADLVRATLRVGLVPALVPELETITIGGAVAGCAVESMAFRYGGFHDSCIEYEIVSGTGEVLWCSSEHDPELFEMVHGSYGTLGILTKLVFRLVPALPFVRMEYRHFTEHSAFHEELVRCCDAPDVDFVDAIAHANDHFVLCLGRFVDDAPYTSDYRSADIYYVSTRDHREDYLTTRQYLFRFDADCHWATRAIPGMQSRLGRRLLGWLFLGSTTLFRWARWLRPLERRRKHPLVVTDVFIPEGRVEEFYDWYTRCVAYYPLWIVPYRMPKPYPWIARRHHAQRSTDLFVDFAIYGMTDDRPGISFSELLEQKTRELGGIKTLIGRNHYDEDTFWQIYDRDGYERIKQRTDPQNVFRGLYEKRGYSRVSNTTS